MYISSPIYSDNSIQVFHSLQWPKVYKIKKSHRRKSHFFIWQTDECAWVQWLPGERYLSYCTVPSEKLGGIMVLVCFSGVKLRPLVPVKLTLNASIINACILDNFMVLTLWEQFGNLNPTEHF